MGDFNIFSYRLTLKLNQKYRQTDCFNLCFQRVVNIKCQCNFPGIAQTDTMLPSCVNAIQQACMSLQYDDFKINTTEFKNRCAVDCSLECYSVDFNLDISLLDYVSKDYYNLVVSDPVRRVYLESVVFNETLSYELYKESFVALNVYMTTTQHTEITQAPKTTLVDLVANLGGTIGIFLGFSVFSLVEMGELCTQLLLILCFNRKIN